MAIILPTGELILSFYWIHLWFLSNKASSIYAILPPDKGMIFSLLFHTNVNFTWFFWFLNTAVPVMAAITTTWAMPLLFWGGLLFQRYYCFHIRYTTSWDRGVSSFIIYTNGDSKWCLCFSIFPVAFVVPVTIPPNAYHLMHHLFHISEKYSSDYSVEQPQL